MGAETLYLNGRVKLYLKSRLTGQVAFCRSGARQRPGVSIRDGVVPPRSGVGHAHSWEEGGRKRFGSVDFGTGGNRRQPAAFIKALAALVN